MEAPIWRRRKTAKERRVQQLRSDARSIARLMKGLLGAVHHRGNTLSLVGRHLLAALQQGEGQDVQNVSVGIQCVIMDEENLGTPLARRVTFAETVEVVELGAPVPAVSHAAPTLEFELGAPVPALSHAASAPVAEFVDPSLAATYLSPAPVAEYVAQAPVEPDEAPPLVVDKPGSVRRRLVVKAPPVEDCCAMALDDLAETAEPGPWASGFVFAEPVAPAVENPEFPTAHVDEAAPSMCAMKPVADERRLHKMAARGRRPRVRYGVECLPAAA